MQRCECRSGQTGRRPNCERGCSTKARIFWHPVQACDYSFGDNSLFPLIIKVSLTNAAAQAPSSLEDLAPFSGPILGVPSMRQALQLQPIAAPSSRLQPTRVLSRRSQRVTVLRAHIADSIPDPILRAAVKVWSPPPPPPTSLGDWLRSALMMKAGLPFAALEEPRPPELLRYDAHAARCGELRLVAAAGCRSAGITPLTQPSTPAQQSKQMCEKSPRMGI